MSMSLPMVLSIARSRTDVHESYKARKARNRLEQAVFAKRKKVQTFPDGTLWMQVGEEPWY